MWLKALSGNFPGDPVVKNLPYNTGDVGSIPGGQIRILLAAGPLGPRPPATEPVCPS